MKPICLLSEIQDFSPNALEKLQHLFDVKPLEQVEKKHFEKVEVLFVRLKLFIGPVLLSRFRNLRFICSPTTGLNHIDLSFCEKNNINVISLVSDKQFLEKNVTATSEYTWALFLAVWRNIITNYNDVCSGNWDRDKFKSHQLRGKRIGIIGLGRVGKKIRRYAHSFDMQIEYYDPYESTFGGKRNTLEELLINNDIIFISCQYSDETKNLINKNNLNFLKKGSFIINTARGEIVNENDLLAVILKKNFKYVADVIANESSLESSNLTIFTSAKLKNNVFLTSHIAGACYDAMQITEERVTDKLMEKVC